MRPTGRLLEPKRHVIEGDASRRPARIAVVVAWPSETTLTLKRSMVSPSRESAEEGIDLVRLALDRRFDRGRVQDDRGRHDATSSVCSVLPSRLSCISVKPAARIIRSSSAAE
jgi:hypothetical protein